MKKILILLALLFVTNLGISQINFLIDTTTVFVRNNPYDNYTKTKTIVTNIHCILSKETNSVIFNTNNFTADFRVLDLVKSEDDTFDFMIESNGSIYLFKIDLPNNKLYLVFGDSTYNWIKIFHIYQYWSDTKKY